MPLRGLGPWRGFGFCACFAGARSETKRKGFGFCACFAGARSETKGKVKEEEKRAR